ncbi:hypothetical protein KPH14_009160 [Odynerus spinipes]|uniref:Cytochrome c oxidase subunit n=1 Tax=Odynerus spinipes TaxID=1348599 RepID=A0AAD9RNY8_9HYME|nr:hypothetical protein KPH14_009160 [Odynerus spinipes]
MAASASINRTLARNFAHAATGPGKSDPARKWKFIYYFVGIPAMALSGLNCYLNGGHGDPPEFVPYEHLRIRNKRFPWGDGQRSFFHNPHTNPLPSGYEDH